MSDNSKHNQKKSSLWPIGLAITYISFMVILIGIVVFSTYNQVDLVAEDYYEKEEEYSDFYQQIIKQVSTTLAFWFYNQASSQKEFEEIMDKVEKGEL